MRRFSILVVDDHPMFRMALRLSLEDHPDLLAAGEAGSLSEARERIIETHPDLVLLDLNLPDGSGLELLPFCRELSPPVRCLVLTSSDDTQDISTAVEAGAAGYLLKDSSPDLLLKAVKDVLAGGNYLSARAAGALLNGMRNSKKESPDPVSALLSPREKEILHYLGEGASNPQIAGALLIAESTLRTHLQHILKKLELNNRSQAVIFAIKNKL